MRCVRIPGHDVALNLALEEAFLAALRPEDPGWFLLWQNAPCLVIGRHQNTGDEVDIAKAESLGVAIVRRTTGGGAVYHDLGNLCFSFLEYRPGIRQADFARYATPIVRALARLGIQAEVSGRNDLTVQGRKISGSAQTLQGARVLHHGTLMVDLDAGVMESLLHPDPEKYRSKGVASVRARVANISEFWRKGACMEDLCAALLQEVGGEERQVPGDIMAEACRIADARYRTWEWNIGASPAWTEQKKRRFAWGQVDVRYDVFRGVIKACRIYGDFFSLRPIAELEGQLCGLARRPECIAEHLQKVPLTEWFAGGTQEELCEFLAKM